MKAEMPVRHWATLPEAQIIPNLLAKAEGRVARDGKKSKDFRCPLGPAPRTISPTCAPPLRLPRLRSVRSTRPKSYLAKDRRDAKVVMVGEQPGDEEDSKGHPFVGPAGRLLSKAMHEAGLDREKIYVTNAVKHFKFIERGKRRIHAKPSGIEISACRPWLEAELERNRTGTRGLSGSNCRAVSDGPRFSHHRRARQVLSSSLGKRTGGHHPSFGHPAHAGPLR